MALANESILDPAVIESLASLVGSKKTATRALCAASLGHAHVSEARAAELLEVLARDPEERVRLASAQALGRLASHSPLAVPAVQRAALASREARVILAALEMLAFHRCTHPELAPVLATLAEGGSGVRDTAVAAEACRALRHFPPTVRLPLLRRILRTHLSLPVSLPRDLALDQLEELEPEGPPLPQELLERLLACGALRDGEAASEDSRFAYSSETRSRTLLTRLLASPLATQALFQALAGARRPDLRPFVSQLRQRLGGAPLEPETLAALERGLASPDPWIRASARTLFLCAPAQAHLAEPRLASLLTSVDEPTRTLAAEALYALERLRPESVEALTRLALEHSEGPDGRAAREALDRHAPPAPLPAMGWDASARFRWLLPLDFLTGEEPLLDEQGRLYFPWWKEDAPAPGDVPGAPGATLGLARLRWGPGGPEVETFPVPWRPPQAPPPGTGEWRKLRLVTRVGDDLLCLLSRRRYSRAQGVQTTHGFLLFNPITHTWSQSLPSPRGIPSHRVALDAHLEDASRCVSGRRYLVWKDRRGQLKALADFTNRDSTEYETSDEVKEAYQELRETHRAATLHHALEVETPRGGEEPWKLHVPKTEAWAPRRDTRSSWRLYGVRRALFQHHPRLRAEDVRSLQCRAAHRLPDASGRPHLVLFVEARLHAVEAALLSQSPRVQALLVLEDGSRSA